MTEPDTAACVAALRDLIHYLPCTRCGPWSDECDDWPLALRIEGLIKTAGTAAGLAELVRLSDDVERQKALR